MFTLASDSITDLCFVPLKPMFELSNGWQPGKNDQLMFTKVKK